MSSDGSRYQSFYLRTKNGRSDDQLQRNHSAQYISVPEFPWQRLRQETPGKYETYVDLVPGEWTKVRIEVDGEKARLFVNGSEQPSLIVNDFKHGPSKGAVALWIGPGTWRTSPICESHVNEFLQRFECPSAEIFKHVENLLSNLQQRVLRFMASLSTSAAVATSRPSARHTTDRRNGRPWYRSAGP
jgi:hypothetical protein